MASLILLPLVGCSRDDNPDPLADIVQANEEKDLQNRNFTSDCGVENPLGLASARMIYRFEGANVIRTTNQYITPDCSGDAAIRFEERGDFDIRKEETTPDGGKGIDIHYTSLWVTTLTPEGVTIANGLQLCSANDWSVNSTRDQTAHANEATCFRVEVPRMNRNLYRVDANVLYLGPASDKNNETRPSGLDMNVKFTVQ